jgi:hypothetical protein
VEPIPGSGVDADVGHELRRVTTYLTPREFGRLQEVRKAWDLGGAPVAEVLRKAIDVAAERGR